MNKSPASRRHTHTLPTPTPREYTDRPSGGGIGTRSHIEYANDDRRNANIRGPTRARIPYSDWGLGKETKQPHTSVFRSSKKENTGHRQEQYKLRVLKRNLKLKDRQRIYLLI
jgi:ribosomal protein S10